jgi:hypothetical protein
MKVAAGVVVFSMLFATIYGVAFATVYPLVEIDGNMIGLFALLGLVTSLVFAGIWAAFTKK